MTRDFPTALLAYFDRRAIHLPARAGEVAIRCFDPDRHSNGDAHPSLRVNLETAQFHCDPCGARGGAKELVAAFEKCDAAAAMKILFPDELKRRPARTARADRPEAERSMARAARPAKKSAAALRDVMGRYRDALAKPGSPEPEPASPAAASALSWLAASWHVDRATVDRYFVGLGPVARGEAGGDTFSLACPSTDGALAISGIKLYRPRWKELRLQPANEKAVSTPGSTPGLFGGHLLRDGAAAGKTVLVVGGEKDALVAAATFASVEEEGASILVVANARGEGGWGAPRPGPGKADVARELAAAIVGAKPAAIVLALDVNESTRGLPAAVSAFARAGAPPTLVRALAYPEVFAGSYPKGGLAQLVLDPDREDAAAGSPPRWSVDAIRALVLNAPPAPAPATAAASVEGETLGAATKPTNATDLGNARRLVARHGAHLRYVASAGKWFIWDGARWVMDMSDEISRRAEETVDSIFKDAAAIQDDADARESLFKHAIRSESARSLAAMIALARPMAPIAVPISVFDADDWLYNVANGTIDLRTGALSPHSPARMITKIAPIAYDPAATCPTWESFLDKVFAGKRDLVDFVQRAIGYSLTGSIREQVVFFLYGTGSNGKSTLLEVLRSLLGDYAQTANFSSFLERDKEVVRNDLADLAGARLVTAAETKPGQRLDEGVIKQLTGGDPIKARFLFCEHFTYMPTFKVFLATNHKPVVRGGEHAIWRRLRLIPFEVTFSDAEQDLALPAKLRAELPGILAWAVRGCLDWQRNRLGVSEHVAAATEEYREEMDAIAEFKKERLVEIADARISSKDVYEAYCSWAKENGDEPQTQRWVSNRLIEKGFKLYKVRGVKVYKGLTVRGISGEWGIRGGSEGDDLFSTETVNQQNDSDTGGSVDQYRRKYPIARADAPAHHARASARPESLVPDPPGPPDPPAGPPDHQPAHPHDDRHETNPAGSDDAPLDHPHPTPGPAEEVF